MTNETHHILHGNGAVVLFDGVCNLCQRSVRFIIPRDPNRYFRFASLQSSAAVTLLDGSGVDLKTVNSLILIESGKIYIESSAVLRICKKLNGAWPVLYVLMIIPKPIRDGIYRFIAKRRIRWFGQADACMVPTPEHRSRFIDDISL